MLDNIFPRVRNFVKPHAVLSRNASAFLNKLSINKEAVAFGACLVVFIAIRIWGLDFGLPQRFQLDEPPSIIAALKLGTGDFHITYPMLSPNLIEFMYLGLFGMLFVWYVITGQVASINDFPAKYITNPTDFYLLARGLSVAASLATIILLYRMTRRVYGIRSALIASLFLGFSFLDVRHAHFAEPYGFISFFVLASTLLVILYVRSGKVRELGLACILCGVAIGLRYSMIPSFITILLGIFLRNQAYPRERSLFSYLVVLATTLSLGLILGAPALLLNTSTYFTNLKILADLSTSGDGLWGLVLTDMSALRFYAYIFATTVGIPFGVLCLGGIALTFIRHKPEDLILLPFPTTYLILLMLPSSASTSYARYLVPLLPFLALFASTATVSFVRGCLGFSSAKIQSFALAVILIIVLIPSTYNIVLLDKLWTRTDTRTQAKMWIEENIPAGAKIATQWHGPPLSTLDDPEPGSYLNYEVKEIYPFADDDTLYQLSNYVREGFEYVVLSSYVYELPHSDPSKDHLRKSFYRSLDQSAVLVAEFTPYDGEVKPPFFFEQIWGPITDLPDFTRPGPTIKLYQLR
ncbi:MAG: glycosyltransferase family 39 protein [Anaerolineales bacterium]|nr:glycosyltransferase family 39 protein [Anaerolineales bacterium]